MERPEPPSSLSKGRANASSAPGDLGYYDKSVFLSSTGQEHDQRAWLQVWTCAVRNDCGIGPSRVRSLPSFPHRTRGVPNTKAVYRLACAPGKPRNRRITLVQGKCALKVAPKKVVFVDACPISHAKILWKKPDTGEMADLSCPREAMCLYLHFAGYQS